MASNEPLAKALEEIESLKSQLSEFKTDYAAVVGKLTREILDLKRETSIARVNGERDSCMAIIDIRFPDHVFAVTLKDQLVADVGAVKSEIVESANPYSIRDAFHERWKKKFADLRVDLL